MLKKPLCHHEEVGKGESDTQAVRILGQALAMYLDETEYILDGAEGVSRPDPYAEKLSVAGFVPFG
jgi:hypothetical protein